MSIPCTDNAVVINAVTQTTTSSVYDVSKRQLKSLQFVASGITSGNGVFQVQISNDNVNFVNYQSPITISANGSSFYFFPSGDYFRTLRIVCTVTTDGTYSATLEAGG